MKKILNLYFNLIRYVCPSFGTLLVSVPTYSSGNRNDEDLPNIVLIVADDLGYGDLGSYGNKVNITPNLDQLAKDGVRFTNFYVTSPASTPSRGSLLTGRYPQRNGTYELFRNDRVNDKHIYTQYEYSISPEMILGMDLREVLLPELLKKKNYSNGIFGKWDLGQLLRYLPLQRGFDDFYGFSNTGIDYYTHERYFIPSMFRNNDRTVEDKGMYATYLFEREALKFIEKNKNNKFLLYLPYNAPHTASNWEVGGAQVPEKYSKLYSDKIPAKRREYLGAITCMDNSIGNILGRLEQLGLAENTLVIFISDNGAGSVQSNHPLNGNKATMWEGGLRVPCIIKWPKNISKGQVVNNFLSTLEIFPTLLSITKIDIPESIVIDGFDISPLLTGTDKNLKRNEMYWEFREEYAARIGELKLVKSKRRTSNNGLFNLTSDIGESIDLSAREQNKLEFIENKFKQWKIEMNNAEHRGPFKDF